MFKAKIISGCWDEESIELSGMPKDYVLSARQLIVLEESEYEGIVAALEKVLGLCNKLDVHDMNCAVQASGVCDMMDAMGCTCLIDKAKQTLRQAKEKP